jgi:hypothetical protein
MAGSRRPEVGSGCGHADPSGRRGAVAATAARGWARRARGWARWLVRGLSYFFCFFI